MPYWCGNTLSVKGNSKIAQLQLKGFVEKSKSGNGDFSLNPTFPLPSSELDIQLGSGMDNGLAIIKFRNGDDKLLKPYLDYEWVKKAKLRSLEEIEESLIKSKHADLKLGLKAFNNLKKYGVTDYSHWCEKNWGCNSDTWDSSIKIDKTNSFEVFFFTPWGPPLSWLNKVSIDYPDLRLNLKWAVSDTKCGTISTFNGKLTT